MVCGARYLSNMASHIEWESQGRLQLFQNHASRGNKISINPPSLTKPGGGGGGGNSMTPGVLILPAKAGMLSAMTRIHDARRAFRVLI